MPLPSLIQGSEKHAHPHVLPQSSERHRQNWRHGGCIEARWRDAVTAFALAKRIDWLTIEHKLRCLSRLLLPAIFRFFGHGAPREQRLCSSGTRSLPQLI